MNKIKQLSLSLVFLMALSSTVFAASNLVVQVFQPKTPTNTDNFKLNFVALDTDNNPVTVKCFKQSQGESSFSQFDGDKVLKSGGNSGFCSVTSSILNSEGTYKFYVEANGTKSNEVSVDFKTSTPGTPNSYSKEKTGACEYTVKFRTDKDGGKTTKVVLYRSDTTNFNADAGSQVESRNVGSDTAIEIKNTVPDCNKTYYYAVRAYDSAGNGSGIIGDEVIITTNSTSTTTTTGSNTGTSAIAVQSSTVTNPEEGTASPTGEGVNQEISISPSVSPEILGTATKDPFWKSKNFRIGVIAVLVLAFLAFRKKDK